jgi:hypothetical protein
MRISGRGAIIIGLSSLIAQPAPARSAGDFVMAPLSERCEASMAFIQTQKPARHRRLVFWKGGWGPSVSDAARRRDWGPPPARVGGRGAPAPPAGLLTRMQRARSIDAVGACASIRAYLAGHGMPFGKAATDAAAKPDKDAMYKGTILSVFLPIMAAGGNDAVLVSSEVSGILMSHTLLNYVHLVPMENGGWSASPSIPSARI